MARLGRPAAVAEDGGKDVYKRQIYITERTESAAYGVRWHHHVIMSGDGLTREEIEEKWTKRHGGFCNTRRAQPVSYTHLDVYKRQAEYIFGHDGDSAFFSDFAGYDGAFFMCA